MLNVPMIVQEGHVHHHSESLVYPGGERRRRLDLTKGESCRLQSKLVVELRFYDANTMQTWESGWLYAYYILMSQIESIQIIFNK